MLLLYWVLGAVFIVMLAWVCVFVPVATETVRFSVLKRSSLVLLAAAFAVILYVFFGSMPALRTHWLAQKEQKTAEAILKTMPSKKAVIDQLQALLRQEPNRPKGWALLGRIRMSQGKTDQAITAYQNAWHLDVSNMSYAIGLAEALLLANKAFPDSLLKQCEKGLSIEKLSQSKAALLNVLAIHSYRKKDYLQSIRYWKKALAYYPTESVDEKQLLQMIHKAQALKSGTMPG